MTDQEAANLLAIYAELLVRAYEGERSSYGLLLDAAVIVGKVNNTEQVG